ncbi:cylicin-1 [Erinaceus europaeus]|uniref:Cylicin-1 n=1 Tax=Erinaceus europaeus TaxID=9365 RepID=A0A1S3AF78_ERIEU|nr:cylicin-1 [Erinaceus europaeus]
MNGEDPCCLMFKKAIDGGQSQEGDLGAADAVSSKRQHPATWDFMDRVGLEHLKDFCPEFVENLRRHSAPESRLLVPNPNRSKAFQSLKGSVRCLGNMINEDIQTQNSLCRKEVNMKSYDNFIPISESSTKSWSQEYFALTFPKSPQPGSKKRSRPRELHITVPGYDIRKPEGVQKPAHMWIRHSLRKKFQRPSIYLTVRKQIPFRQNCTPKISHEKNQSKMSKYDKKINFRKRVKKITGPQEKTAEFYRTVASEKPRKGNKTDKTSLKPSRGSELSNKSIFKSEINLKSTYFKAASVKNSKKEKISNNSSRKDTKSKCSKKGSNISKNDSDILKPSLEDSSNMESIVYLEESGDKFKCFRKWPKNSSQNNSKKPSKMESKNSDADSVDSKDAKKDAKKDKKIMKKDNKKKDANKETESTGADSVDSKDAKKDLKKGKKDSKKDKKKDAKKDSLTTDADSQDSKDAKKDPKKTRKDSKKGDKKKDAKKDSLPNDAESESLIESKKGKKDKKDDKKNDAKKEVMSTDADSESEWDSKKDEKDDKKDKKDLEKDETNKSAIKSEESTETESELESKKDKGAKKVKKDDKKQEAKSIESVGAESSEVSKKDQKKKSEMIKSANVQSEEGFYKPGRKKKSVDESDATSTDLKKETPGPKRESKNLFRKTTFKGKEKNLCVGRVPLSRERPKLPPCEPLLPLLKMKTLCSDKMTTPLPKPRHAPLPEAKWIHKFL